MFYSISHQLKEKQKSQKPGKLKGHVYLTVTHVYLKLIDHVNLFSTIPNPRFCFKQTTCYTIDIYRILNRTLAEIIQCIHELDKLSTK